MGAVATLTGFQKDIDVYKGLHTRKTGVVNALTRFSKDGAGDALGIVQNVAKAAGLLGGDAAIAGEVARSCSMAKNFLAIPKMPEKIQGAVKALSPSCEDSAASRIDDVLDGVVGVAEKTLNIAASLGSNLAGAVAKHPVADGIFTAAGLYSSAYSITKSAYAINTMNNAITPELETEITESCGEEKASGIKSSMRKAVQLMTASKSFDIVADICRVALGVFALLGVASAAGVSFLAIAIPAPALLAISLVSLAAVTASFFTKQSAIDEAYQMEAVMTA